MRVAAYVFYALAVLAAGVGIYSMTTAGDVFGRPLATLTVILIFGGATVLFGLIGAGLHSVARQREME